MMISYLDAMNGDHLDIPGAELIIEQDGGHHYHQGQQWGRQDVNDQGLLTKESVRIPI